LLRVISHWGIGALALMSLVYLLTRSALRWITLSFASKKEGLRSFLPAGERVGKRSYAGVSKFIAMQ